MQAFSVFLLASSAGFVVRPPAALHSIMHRPGFVVMQEEMVDAVDAPSWNDPREGKPFGEADGPNRPIGKVRAAVEAYQPRGISDATVIKPQYIGVDDDEPWHATSRETVVLTSAAAGAATEKSLPFIQPETDLTIALSKAESESDAKKARDAAIKAGARPGCPALDTAEKVIKAFAKDADAGKKARPKAPKPAGAQGAGWDGMKRGMAKTHDNSVA